MLVRLAGQPALQPAHPGAGEPRCFREGGSSEVVAADRDLHLTQVAETR